MSEQILWFSFADGCFLLNTLSYHEPAKTLGIQQSQFCFGPWPLESDVGQALVKQDISITCPIQSLDSVCTPAAEQEQTFFIQMTAELLCHNSGQPVNPQAKVCIAAGNVVIADLAEIDHSD